MFSGENLACGEVERESGLVSAEVVDVEDELVGEVLLVAPYHPANAGIHEPVLVPAYVDAFHQRQPEVLLQLRVQERRDEPALAASTWIGVSQLQHRVKNH